MDTVHTNHHIAYLIANERLGLLNNDEANELETWIKAKPEHYRLYKRLREKDYTEDITLYIHLDTEKTLTLYKKRYTGQSKHFIYRWTSVAAAIIVLMTVSIIVFHSEKQATVPVTAIHPGTSRAELILEDGSVRKLESVQQTEEIKIGNKVIRNTGTQICYANDSLNFDISAEFKLAYNELRIPTGGEYQLILSDGTKVWLNSQTCLRFPKEFGKTDRTVYLEGEAYFEVTKDKQRPFYVKTANEINIEVLGTSFNVRAYRDEMNIETVLEEGQVKMSQNFQDAYLNPGMRAVYHGKDKKINIEMVDTELYTAWRKGEFVFLNETTENILNKLARWYGMNVFYQNKQVKELIFSGSIQKYETIQNLLDVMELSGGIHFETKGNTIIVSCAE